MVILVLNVAGTMTVIVVVFVNKLIGITIRMINTDTNTDSNGRRRDST